MDNKDHFVMLWSDRLSSSIMEETPATRELFTAILLLCDSEGRFRATPQYLSRVAVIPLDQVEVGLEALQSPDPHSTSKDCDGRRVVNEGQNIWYVPTYKSYRERQKKKTENLNAAERMRTLRNKPEQDRNPVSVDVSVDVDVKDKGDCKGGRKKVSDRPEYTTRFEKFWDESWRRGNKRSAFDTWEHMLPDEQVAAVTVVGKWSGAFEQRDAQKRPHVVTWLNQRGWEDEVSAEYGKGKESVSPEVKSKYAKFTAGRKK